MTLPISWSPNLSIRKGIGNDDSMRMGIFWPYSRTQSLSRLESELNPDPMDIRNHLELAVVAESIGVDFALIADGYATQSVQASEIGYQDPSTHAVLTALPLLMATRQLGVLSTMHTTFLHPVQIARTAGHMDWLSGGRWGWNIVAGYRPAEAALFGHDEMPGHDERYGVTEESVELVKTLWSPDPVDHEGKYFKVRGRMRSPKPATRPLLVSAASSARGWEFAIKHCDYLFGYPPIMEDIAPFCQRLRDACAEMKVERPIKMVIIADVFIRDEPGQAREEYQALLDSLLGGEAHKIQMSNYSNVVPAGRPPAAAPAFVGTPDEVADQIIAVRQESGVGGLVMRLPLWHAKEAARLEPVFAMLRAAGVWTPPSERNYSW